MAYTRINWEDGQKISNAYVTIDGTKYDVTDSEYIGSTPISADNLNKMDEEISNLSNCNNLIKGHITSERSLSVNSEKTMPITMDFKRGNDFEIVDGTQLKINKNCYIRVTFQAYLTTSVTASDLIHTCIYKGTDLQIRNISRISGSYTAYQVNGILQVNEGDKITFVVRQQEHGGAKVSNDYNSSIFCVEEI